MILFSGKNYSITWKRDNSADYKFFHSDDSNSIVVDSMKGYKNPWRYPFCDIFIYVYNKTDDLFVYRNFWRTFSPSGLKTIDLSGGTQLIPFADFKMRVSVDIIRYLDDTGYNGWRNIGVTQWYNHFENRRAKTYKFQILPRLYAPALPFRMDSSCFNCPIELL